MKPNLLFIFTDEQRFDTLACYGNEYIDMPNLNRLAAQSTVFERAYVTQAVCTPSRSTLMTGLLPHTNGCHNNNLPLPNEVPCISEMVSNDYRKAYMGKWHLGNELYAQHGFDTWVSIEDMYNGHFSPGYDRDKRSDYFHHLIELGYKLPEGQCSFSRDFATHLPEEHGKPRFLADRAAEFIAQPSEDPFMLYVNFLEPHMPFSGPRDDQYDPQDLGLPSNYHHPLDESSSTRNRVLEDLKLGSHHIEGEQGWRKLRARYHGLCSQVDEAVGRILTTLEESGQMDNTLIVFTSDHGDMMGSHQMVAKCTQYEEAIRVPLLIREPGQRQTRRVLLPVSHIDLVPTLLECLGESIPHHLQGQSLKALMDGRREEKSPVVIGWNDWIDGIRERGPEDPVMQKYGRERLLAVCNDPVRTVITDDLIKCTFSTIGECELFDLKMDPDETENLYFKPESRETVKNAYRQLLDWQKQNCDRVMMPLT